jgi:hypothetical protein
MVGAMRKIVTACAAGLALGFGFGAPGAEAAPARLVTDGDISAFVDLMKAYSSASRVGWVIAAPTIAEANAIVANVGLHLGLADQALLQRIKTEAASQAPNVAGAARGPVGWLEPVAARPSNSAACSWQIWVADPSLPAPDQGPTNIPLAPNDRLPVASAATFRIGFAGLLQSKIYAFGETRPGAVRDLANAPDVNIPVAAGETETILLAISRQPVPFLEGIRTALASSSGQRVELGADHALRGNLLGKGRGIGANIQLVGPNMVVAQATTERKVANADTRGSDLLETCTFTLTPAAEAMR